MAEAIRTAVMLMIDSVSGERKKAYPHNGHADKRRYRQDCHVDSQWYSLAIVTTGV